VSDKPYPPITEDDGVSRMYALGKPGEAHHFLAPLVGEWSVVLHMYPGGGTTVTSEGLKSRKRLILDERQIFEEIYEGTIAGWPHRKVTMLGYNAINQRYEFVTADNFDTQQMTYRGIRDEKSGIITMTSAYTQAAYADVVSGDELSQAVGKPISWRSIVGIEMTIRDVLTITSADEHRLQMYFRLAAGDEGLGAEYIYSRA
jgi:hypothetical protein